MVGTGSGILREVVRCLCMERAGVDWRLLEAPRSPLDPAHWRSCSSAPLRTLVAPPSCYRLLLLPVLPVLPHQLQFHRQPAFSFRGIFRVGILISDLSEDTCGYLWPAVTNYNCTPGFSNSKQGKFHTILLVGGSSGS